MVNLPGVFVLLLQELPQSLLRRSLKSEAPRTRAVHAPMNQKPKSFTSVAHRLSAIATTPRSPEAKVLSSSSLRKETTKEGVATMEAAAVGNRLNVMATTRCCNLRCTVSMHQATVARMCTIYHTRSNLPATTTSTPCSTVTVNV